MSTDHTPKPANAKVRLEDVARAADVSISAASMALADHPRISEKTKQKVRQISRDLGYRSPRQDSPARRRSRNAGAALRLGFLLIGNRLQDDTNVSLLHALTSEANAKHVRIELGAIEDATSSQAVTDRMLQFARELDGVLVCGLVDDHLIQCLRETSAAHVVVGQVINKPHRHGVVPGVHVVAPDDMGMGYAAGDYLLSQGHRRIAFIVDTMPRNLCHDRWLAGLRLAHAAAGVAFDEERVITTGRELDQIARTTKAVVALDPAPDALVMPQARLAAGLMPALAQMNRPIPREALVIGGTEEMVRRQNLHTGPAMITNAEALAAAAVDRLLQLIRSPQTPPALLLLPHKQLPSE